MSNSFYNHSIFPTPNAPGSSAQMRNELDLITAGFNKLPTLSGNGYKVAMINSAGTALVASSALQQLALTQSTIDSTPIGSTTRAAGAFTTLSANSTVNLGSAVTIAGGVIDNAIIGGTTPAAGYFTTLSASSGLTGNVTGNLTGNVTGNVTGDVTGNLAGNVTTSTGTSSFNNVTINGTLDMNAGTVGTITGLATPTNSSDAAPKGYVDTQRDTRLALAGGTMSGAIAMGTNRITGLGDPSSAQDASTKNYTDTQDALKLSLSGGTMSGAIAMGTNRITGLGDPLNPQDAATKNYVDSVAQGLDVKASVRAATTGNITLSGTATIDGVALIAGDRVLVKDQTTTSENGIYVVSAGGWGRAPDMDAWAELPGAFVFVEDGSANDNSGWVCTVAPGGTIGSTSVTFEQFSGAGQITAGNGMTKSGNTLNVGTASSARIVVNADNIDLATTGVTAGTYKSVTVDSYGRVTGGTNPTTLSGYGITDAYTQTQVDTALALKLNLSGGTMSGNIAMGSNRITGLAAPSGGADAATKTYVDTADALKLNLSGGTMSGAIAMGGSKITGLADPTVSQDAVTLNYVTTLFGSTASAAASASAAATSATNAATSASNASSSATAAASSATAAAASYDSFDDRYLGPKSSDPTVDNDGNALLTGALYWNTSLNQMKAYSGSAWLISYVPSDFYLPLSGGTLTGALAGTTLTMSGAATIEGLTVGRGAGAVSTNTALGASALAANTTGSRNVAIGSNAATSATTATSNINIGAGSGGGAIGTGSYNVAVGDNSLALATSGSYNIAIGASALLNNTSASQNTAVGNEAGYSNTTGWGHVLIGHRAGYSSTTAVQNTAVGYNALQAATGGFNTALGFSALYSNTTASNNTAVGYQALYANTTGYDLTAVGIGALDANTTGHTNTAVGGAALGANTTGQENVAFGNAAMLNATTGSYNTALGRSALISNTTANSNTAVGYQALYSGTTATNNTAVGLQAGRNLTGSYNDAFGYLAMQGASGSTATENAAFGRLSLYQVSSGSYNIAVGGSALQATTSGSNNTGLGYDALRNNTTAANNTAVGHQAGYSNTTGNTASLLGGEAGFNVTTAAGSVAVGYRAGKGITTGNYNTFIGTFAGDGSGGNVTGAGNTAIGPSAGSSLTTGTYNSFFGPAGQINQGPGGLITTGSKNTIIGAYNGNQAGLDIRTANNYIVLSDGDGNPRVFVDNYGTMALGTTQNVNYGNGFSFGYAGKGLLLQQTVNTDDERVYLTNNAQTRTTSGFTGDFSYNKTGAAATAYYSSGGYVQFLGADVGTAGSTISWTNLFAVKKDQTVALQGASNSSGTGITFPATQSASSDANTLDDYEEGSWTPALSDCGSPTYTENYGRYIKIGRQVTIVMKIAVTGATLTGNRMLLTGLPFAAQDPADAGQRVASRIQGDWQAMGSYAATSGMFRIDSGARMEGVRDNGSGYSVYWTYSELGSSSFEFALGLTYFTAS